MEGVKDRDRPALSLYSPGAEPDRFRSGTPGGGDRAFTLPPLLLIA